MILSFEDFMSRLAVGQLKNTAITDQSQGGIVLPEYQNDILKLTNQGLVDISTKKKLFEETVTLDFVDDQNIYTLDVSPTGEFVNLVSILEIVTSDEKIHTPKNSVHIMQPNQETLRFSTRFMDWHKPSVDIRFQVHHPELENTQAAMNLPNHLYETLALYVAGLYLSHMGGEEHKARGDSYYGLYLNKMSEDTLLNSSNTSEVTDEDRRFADRGFV